MHYCLRSPGLPWSCHSSAHLGAPRNNEGCSTACGHQGGPGHAIPQLIWLPLSTLSYNKGRPSTSRTPLSLPGTGMYYGLRSPGRPWSCHSSAHLGAPRNNEGRITACGNQGAPGHAIAQLIWAPLSELSYNKGPGRPSTSRMPLSLPRTGMYYGLRSLQECPWPRRKNTGRPFIRHLVPVPDHQERPRLPRFYLDLTRRPCIQCSATDCPSGAPRSSQQQRP